MKKSPYPLDQSLGLRWYCSDQEGIGGRLRTEPEDFVVEEIGDHPDKKNGPYLICRLTKLNWDQQRAIKEIAGRLGISHQRIGFAGTKDKRAVTTQYITIYKGDPEKISSLNVPDMTIEPVGQTDQQISLGDLQENRFSIMLRDYSDAQSIQAISESIASFQHDIPNYYGYQRFGVQRPVTHLTGMEILKGNYEEAVRTFICTPSSGETSEYTEGRTLFRDTGDAKEALHKIPVRLSLERSLLHHLVSKPGDYAGAFHSFPRTLRSMFVSAVQSWLFNRTLSMRIEEGRSLSQPVPGDRLVYPDGRVDTVTPGTAKMAQMQVQRSRCRIALYMPGSEPYRISGKDDENMARLMEEEQISADMFRTASSFLETRFSGAHRAATLKTDIDLQTGEKGVSFSFILQPGQYATTVMREIMKADPLMMI